MPLSPEQIAREVTRGRGFLEARQFAEAQAVFRGILTSNPDHVEAWAQLAVTERLLGRVEFAAAAMRRATELDPSNAAYWLSLGGLLCQTNAHGPAVEAFERSLALKPDQADAYLAMSGSLQVLDRFDDSLAACRRAVDAGGDPAITYAQLGSTLRGMARIDEAVQTLREGLRLRPDSPILRSNLLYSIMYHPGYDAAAILREHVEWNRRFGLPLQAQFRPHGNDRDPERRLRIGYVSPDLRTHVTGLNLLPLFESHDHAQFHITAYSDAYSPDATTRSYEKLCDAWRPVADVNDEQLAQLIRHDRIDIMVDLTQHMTRNRLLALARKPAPVQVSFAGYPGTTGLTAIDYRLGDPFLDPPDCDQFYTEKVVRLPATWWCYNGLAMDVAVGPLPARRNGHITFGCLNNCCKLNPATYAFWGRVLAAVPDSRMLLMVPPGQARAGVLEGLEREGVAGSRVEFVPRQLLAQYLDTFNRIDVTLDTIPYNGHTTSMDSLWMGVPVVTLAGDTVGGRGGVSQMTNVGLPELIAHKPEEFVAIAVRLASDLSELANTRATMRLRMKQSPLMDAGGFTRGIEQAYRTMWRQWCGQRRSR